MNWTISFIKALLDGKSRASESYFFSLASIASVCTLAKKNKKRASQNLYFAMFSFLLALVITPNLIVIFLG